MVNHLSPQASESERLRRPAHREGAQPSVDPRPDSHPLLTLQRQLGNAQIQRALAQRQAAEEEEEIQAKRDPAVQREADEGEIQAKRDGTIQREAEEEEIQAKRDTTVQREAEEEEEIQAKRDSTLQRSPEPEVGLEGGPVSAGIEARIQSKRGGGASLDSGTLATMEGSFGEAFDGVRVHHDAESDSLNRSLGAKAFTTGNDIFFRGDASPSDRGLLGHELTHVVQQREGLVAGGGSGMRVGPANDGYEQAADATAATVTSGGAVAQTRRDGE